MLTMAFCCGSMVKRIVSPACTPPSSDEGSSQPVPVDDDMLRKIAELSGGEAYTASSLDQLREVYSNLQQQIGYETIKGDASAGWLRLGALVLALAALGAMVLNRRLPN